MFRKKSLPQVILGQKVDTSALPFCQEAIWVEIKQGRAALKWVHQPYDEDYKSLSALFLHDRPILQADLPVCSTCEALLATGYGIGNIDCKEFSAVTEAINRPYIGLEQAIQSISPLLGLLQDGLYLVADCMAFPTDGNGNFFWAVPNGLTLSPATACRSLYIEDEYYFVGGIPAYLYPSQSTQRFDQSRVNYYRDLLTEGGSFPRAIAYHGIEFSSILLDGHHKAAACALAGEMVPTLTIIPATYLASTYNQPGGTSQERAVVFSKIEVPIELFTAEQLMTLRNKLNPGQLNSKFTYSEGCLIQRRWEPKYLASVEAYPHVDELAQEVALEVNLSDGADIEDCLTDPVGLAARKLEVYIRSYTRLDKAKGRALALRCARCSCDAKLLKSAFKVLAQWKNSPEVEAFFIDWWVNNHEKNSPLSPIVNSFWQEV